jgi:flagellar motility protein MotE (MotC chaperone)
MIRLLQSSWLTALTGCLLFLAVMAALLQPSRFEQVRVAMVEARMPAQEQPSWKFRNPEFEQWVEEIRRQREALALREQQLQELQTRLESERQELNTATQTVYQLQAEFDKSVVRIKDQEAENLKRQAKLMAGMSPEAAAGMVMEMPDDEVVRILFTMKTDEASAILETLSKLGKSEAKFAASITERMRHLLPPDPNPRPKASP